MSRLHHSLGPSVKLENSFYTGCPLSKFHQLPFYVNDNYSASSSIYVIDSDIWMSIAFSVRCYWYYVNFVVDFSHFIWTYPMKRKSEMLITHYQNFVVITRI